jgi:hypothetical protein
MGTLTARMIRARRRIAGAFAGVGLLAMIGFLPGRPVAGSPGVGAERGHREGTGATLAKEY